MRNISFFILELFFLLCVYGCSTHQEFIPEHYEEVIELNDFLFEKPEFIEDTFSNWPFGKEKALCFTWDDGLPIHTKSLVSIFNKYGYKSTFYIITSNLKSGTHDLIEEYRFANETGHELGSHTVNHYSLLSLSKTEMQYEILQSSKDLNTFLGFKPTTFAHPLRKMSPEIDTYILKFYLSSRFSTIQSFRGRIVHSISSKDSFLSLKEEFDSFLENNDYRWIVYSGHGLISKDIPSNGVYEPIESLALDSFLGYVNNNYDDKVWVAPFEDIVFYELIRDGVSLKYGDGKILVDTQVVDSIINEYVHPHAYLTLVFNDASLFFRSRGLKNVRIVNNVAFVTLDLRKSRVLYYE